jgi:hypothetical protein
VPVLPSGANSLDGSSHRLWSRNRVRFSRVLDVVRIRDPVCHASSKGNPGLSCLPAAEIVNGLLTTIQGCLVPSNQFPEPAPDVLAPVIILIFGLRQTIMRVVIKSVRRDDIKWGKDLVEGPQRSPLPESVTQVRQICFRVAQKVQRTVE